MRGKGQKGFTILETMLFLSVSSLLFIGLISGMQYMINSARFSDAVSALQTIVSSQYEEVRTGINSRNESLQNVCGVGSTIVTPGNSDCLILGKIIRFSNNSSDITINYVIGDPVNYQAVNNMSDTDAINLSNTRISPIQSESTQIKWGAYYTKGISLSGSGAQSNVNYQAIAIIRNPLSGSIFTYTFPDSVNYSAANLTSKGVIGSSIALLVANGSVGGASGAAICVDSGSTSSSINTASIADAKATFLPDSVELKQLREDCKR